jgi:hypothetical protein
LRRADHIELFGGGRCPNPDTVIGPAHKQGGLGGVEADDERVGGVVGETLAEVDA